MGEFRAHEKKSLQIPGSSKQSNKPVVHFPVGGAASPLYILKQLAEYQ